MQLIRMYSENYDSIEDAEACGALYSTEVSDSVSEDDIKKLIEITCDCWGINSPTIEITNIPKPI